MKKQFATYEIALAMKELGFDEPCLGYFPNVENSDKTMIFFDRVPEYTINSLFDKNPTNYHFTAPLWQQCVDWFREEYKINILIVPVFACYQMRISKYDEIEDDNIEVDIDCLDFKDFTSYNECRYEAVLKAIELCKQKEQ